MSEVSGPENLDVERAQNIPKASQELDDDILHALVTCLNLQQ